jgi:hypothetical protein
MQHDRHAGLRELPGGLRAGEAAANDVNSFKGHPSKLGVVRVVGNGPLKTKTPATGAGAFE